MKFIGFTMVRNEEDIIEQFVRHNLNYLDKLYIFDHYSLDNTEKIITRLVDEGLPVVPLLDVKNRFSQGYMQAEIMSVAMHHAIMDNGPAVYFPMDADEFIHLNVPLETLKQQLADLPGDQSYNVPYQNMIFPEDAGVEYFSNAPKSFNLLERWDKTRNRDSKAVLKLANPAIREGLTLIQGNHVFVHDQVIMEKLGSTLDSIRYIHVPVRSPQQALRKFVVGWLSNVQRFGKETDVATHWKLAFDKICAEGLEPSPQLAQMLNTIYTGAVDAENDYETVDSAELFKYDLAYGHMRQAGLGVVLQAIEADFDKAFIRSLHAKS